VQRENDLLVRTIVAAALLLTWLLPIARLAVLPAQRAQALAADEICRARWEPAPQRAGGAEPSALGPLPALSADPRIGEIAELFEPTMVREWRAELARAVFVAMAVVALLAGWRWAPWLAIGAAILYLQQYGLDWDGYRLLAVTESPRLWWVAIRQWSAALWSERLIAPAMVWVALLGPCWMLLHAAWVRGRAGRAAWSGRALVRRPFA